MLTTYISNISPRSRSNPSSSLSFLSDARLVNVDFVEAPTELTPNAGLDITGENAVATVARQMAIKIIFIVQFSVTENQMYTVTYNDSVTSRAS